MLSIAPAVSADPAYIITAEQWAVPRSAEVLLKMPALRTAIQTMQATPGNRLLIRYPGGDEGALWMSELRSWLISLGVSSQKIESVPGSEVNQIELDIISSLPDIRKPASN
jgi:hypothetical protein